MEFVIVRDEFPDEEEEEEAEEIPKPALGSVKSLQFHSSPEGTQTANSDDDVSNNCLWRLIDIDIINPCSCLQDINIYCADNSHLLVITCW